MELTPHCTPARPPDPLRGTSAAAGVAVVALGGALSLLDRVRRRRP